MAVITLATRQHSVVLDVSGFESTGMTIDALAMHWSWRPAEGWHLWKAELRGFKFKKDGTPGQSRASASLIVPRLHPPHRWIEHAPEWAIQQATMHWPRES